MLDPKARRMVPLRFNEAQVLLQRHIEWFRTHRFPVRIVACKARRAGMSTGVQANMYHDTSNNENTNTLIVANQGKPSENVLKMATGFWRSTPEKLGGIVMRPRLPESYRNNPPKDRLEFPDLNSNFFVASARSLDQYLGYFFQNQHATEVAYYNDGAELFRALDPTLVDDPHSMQVLESTPNGMSGRGAFFYEQCMIADRNVRDEILEPGATRLLFIEWHRMTKSFALQFASDDKRASFSRTITKDEREVQQRYPHVSLEQLAWKRQVMKKPAFNGDEEIFDQEYPSDLATAFLSSGESLFSRAAIKRLVANKREPIWTGDIYWGESDKKNERERIHDLIRRPRYLTPGESDSDGFKSHVLGGSRSSLRVWAWPVKGDRIFIAGDVGGGDPGSKDGDYSVLKVGRLADDPMQNDEVIMTWRGRLNPLDFAEVASALAWAIKYRVGEEVMAPELAIEWQGPGVSCNTYLAKNQLYPHCYMYVDYSKKNAPRTRHLGWESNARTKPMMVNFTQKMIERDLIDEPDEVTILELSAYKKFDDFGDTGSFGGESGQHDDTVSTLQILCVRLRYGATVSDEQAEIGEVDQSDDDDDFAWDPFHDEVDMDSPMTADELIEENDEEGLFYHRTIA